MGKYTAKSRRALRGSARVYMSRQRALKKLQISMDEFRKLCILKGIFPRNPKKKKEGSDKTYYLKKDVDFLAHERIIRTMRAYNAYRKKTMKAAVRRERDKLRQLRLNRPRYTLDHIVLERYPNFSDALAELDDALCLVALFATLPGEIHKGIATRRIRNCKRLMNEFLNYIMITHSLRKTFVSIKGYYYQAEVEGQTLTWVSPHKFSQVLPNEVDYSVMLTFLELYECMLNFVNFRLYTSRNLIYPPVIDRVTDAGGRDIGAVRVEEAPVAASPGDQASEAVRQPKLSATELEAARDALEDAMVESEEDEEGEEERAAADDPNVEDEGDEIKEGEKAEKSLLFFSKKFVLARETPVSELEFVIRSFGGSIVLEDDVEKASPENKLLEGVTHWVMDRPGLRGTRIITVEYVQPQYVFDCVNASVLLPASLYGPGVKLPPHLSPFVGEEEDGGYKPWFKEIIERIKAGDQTVAEEAAFAAYNSGKNVSWNAEGRGHEETDVAAEDPSAAATEGEPEESDSEEEDDDGQESADEEKMEEGEGLARTGRKEGAVAERSALEEDENIALKKMMMSKKKRRAYNAIQRGEREALARRRKLIERRKALGMRIAKRTGNSKGRSAAFRK